MSYHLKDFCGKSETKIHLGNTEKDYFWQKRYARLKRTEYSKTNFDEKIRPKVGHH